MTADRDLAMDSKAWPFQEARRLLDRLGAKPPEKGYVLFETGYGPSGLPHIGTFGEVVRTTMVRQAFHRLSDIPTRLFAFSDDMDGLRRVPDNIPNKEMVAQHLGKPLTAIPDPFGTHDSFGAHNNARLRGFLDGFGFEYEFVSSTECYRSGRFDNALLRVLACYDQVMKVMLKSLRAERQKTYSPFLPVCPETGVVLQVPIVEHDAAAGTVVYENERGEKVETPVTGGRCKLQWKPDWAMRWYALGVDYEMSGKDLIDSVKLAKAICNILGANPPEDFTYELFLDERGEKISKSRGNGLSVEEWLAYAPPESLALFMYGAPKRAKRLYFDIIPRQVDDYIKLLEAYPDQDPAERLDNPVWHIHNGAPPVSDAPVGFALLLNLASVVNADDPSILWGFVTRYAPGVSAEGNPLLARMIDYALAYYRDFVKPAKTYRAPDATERAALADLATLLEMTPADTDAEAIQNEIYEIGKRHSFENLRDWFKALYQVLLGQDQGPRFGSFVALYGVEATALLIRRALAGENLGAE
jgi:lysyl-tRNA synthetase class 1